MSYLPTIYKDFTKQFPKLAKTYNTLAEDCYKAGPLEAKTARLVKLGIAIGLHSEGGVKSHARRALAEGVSPDEIRHAVLMAMTTAGFPYMIASLKWVDEVIAKSSK